MLSRVAVVGPQDLVTKIIMDGTDFPELELIPLPYEKETEALDLIKTKMHKVDVVIFAGPVPYLLTKGKIPSYLPLVYVRYSGVALYRVLFQILQQNQGTINLIEHLSIDTLPASAVKETYEELGLNSSQVYVLDEKTLLNSTAQIVEHRHSYESGLTMAAVCCLTSTYKELLKLKIPAYRICPTRFDIREALRLAKSEGLALYHRKAQVAVVILKMEHRSLSSGTTNPQRRTLELHQLLLDYGEETGATVSFIGVDEFIIFSTRGALETATMNFSQAPLINEIQTKVGIDVALGIGIGHSAAEAENNARTALQQSRYAGWNNCCILQESGIMIGPIGSVSPLTYEMRSLKSELLAMAGQSGLSVTTVSRLEATMANYGRTTLTANEVAGGLGLSLRSARRILNTLEQASLATVVGMEQPAGKGRPRQVYDLRLSGKGDATPMDKNIY